MRLRFLGLRIPQNYLDVSDSSSPTNQISNREVVDMRYTSEFSIETPNSSSRQGLEVIEVEIRTTDDSLLDWPQCLPPIDGVIICYDSSIKVSYQPVEGLLSG
jgi:hypothetical protein